MAACSFASSADMFCSTYISPSLRAGICKLYACLLMTTLSPDSGSEGTERDSTRVGTRVRVSSCLPLPVLLHMCERCLRSVHLPESGRYASGRRRTVCSRRIAAADVCTSSRLTPALPVCFGSTGCLREFSSRIVLSNSAELEGTGKNMLPTLEAPPLDGRLALEAPLDGRLAAPANAPEPLLVLV
jgi:hypothetical protein